MISSFSTLLAEMGLFADYNIQVYNKTCGQTLEKVSSMLTDLGRI